ncbi:Eco57I restriction-modification methylase domain-containing protein [Streptococcus uberis]|uniref:Eco57I restriction-modification methylase domain-containing protein n=1 Tax=Streptococcus uberis TaxID=1349 RepID=UPI001939C9D9|nr:Eco57I restriction-modification methylase domain-containing protein [Streptococcus uberis]
MNDKSKQTLEKLNGVFYSPSEIVDFLSKWVADTESKIDVLEPSAGEGRFVKKIISENANANVTAVEIDSLECNKINNTNNALVINDDFYNFYEKVKDKNRYDVVIGNPPYIRYQFLSEEQREFQSDILKRNKMKPNKLINSWVAFTVAGIELCKSGGKFAFVLPTDLLQVSYAKELREFVFKKLEEVTIINFSNIVFSGIQQDVVLLFGIKRRKNITNKLVRNIYLQNLSQLSDELHDIPFENYDFENSDKWRKFLFDKNFLHFYEGKFLENTFSINDVSKIEIGITTGNNKVFVVDSDIIKKYSLNRFKLPLVGRSFDVKGIFYNEKDLENNSQDKKKIWLLDFNNKKLNSGALKYIKEIESIKQHTGYKLDLREKWYEVPSIWIPDAFLLRRIGNYPKIVKNDVNATSTDTFHRVKFKENINPYKFMVIFYSSLTLLTFELEGRVFGGGALEILPGDLKNIRLPKINNDDINFKEISKELDNKLRNNQDISQIVQWIDDLIQPHSNLTKEEFNLTYKAWKKLRDNRI